MSMKVPFTRIGDIISAEVEVEKERVKDVSLVEFKDHIERVFTEAKIEILRKHLISIDNILRANEKAKEMVANGMEAIVISEEAESVLTFARENVEGMTLDIKDDEINFVIPNERAAMMLEYGTSEIPPIPIMADLRNAIFETAAALTVAKMLGLEKEVEG